MLGSLWDNFGVIWGSLWGNFGDSLSFYGVKVGGEIVDVFVDAFRVEKGPEDSGFVLQKHIKY